MLNLIACISLITLSFKTSLPSFVKKFRVELSYPSSDVEIRTLTSLVSAQLCNALRLTWLEEWWLSSILFQFCSWDNFGSVPGFLEAEQIIIVSSCGVELSTDFSSVMKNTNYAFLKIAEWRFGQWYKCRVEYH